LSQTCIKEDDIATCKSTFPERLLDSWVEYVLLRENSIKELVTPV